LARIHRKWRDRRTAQFLAFTLGDLDGDWRTVKTESAGRSQWRYRRPLTPPSSRGALVRFQTETLPALREQSRPIWDAAQDVRGIAAYTADWALAEEMAPTMTRIMTGYNNGPGWDGDTHINANNALNDRRIEIEPADRLINGPAQSTCMDADPHAQGAVTP